MPVLQSAAVEIKYGLRMFCKGTFSQVPLPGTFLSLPVLPQFPLAPQVSTSWWLHPPQIRSMPHSAIPGPHNFPSQQLVEFDITPLWK